MCLVILMLVNTMVNTMMSMRMTTVRARHGARVMARIECVERLELLAREEGDADREVEEVVLDAVGHVPSILGRRIEGWDACGKVEWLGEVVT